MPRDSRLRRLAAQLLAEPSDKTGMADWASRIGMSERNMSRLLLQEVGLSFGRWRRQLHVILSLQRLTRSDSVHWEACLCYFGFHLFGKLIQQACTVGIIHDA